MLGLGKKTKEQLEELQRKLEASESESASLRRQLEEAKETIEATPDMTAEVNRRMNSALASIGVNTFANEFFQAGREVSDLSVVETFRGLDGAEKREFYVKNKAAIMRAMTAQ